MADRSFDLVVVGTGTGLDVAGTFAERGWRVAIVDKDPPGGTCLVRGCIPSKMLIHSADVAATIRGADRFGILPRGFDVAFPSLMKRVRDHVDGESREIDQALRRSENPRFFVGRGRFVGDKRFQVGEDVLVADRFLLASGSRPRIPPIPGLTGSGFLTSTEALSRPKLPRSLIILGGGFIAAELGHFFGALGAKVTVVQKHDVLLAKDDRDVAERFTASFAKRHRVVLSAETSRVERRGDEVHVTVRSRGSEETLVAEDLLVAIGVEPNSDTLDLERTGVAVDERGYIRTDGYLASTREGIYALGDAVGRWNLKHAANHEANYVIHNLANPHDRVEVDYQAMPRAVFSSPQVAAVGATEESLQEEGAEYLVGLWEFHDTGMGKALDEREGLVKLLVDRASGRILGCHIVGPEASTLLHEVVVAMTLGATADDLARVIHVHPALNEVVQRAAASLRPPKERS